MSSRRESHGALPTCFDTEGKILSGWRELYQLLNYHMPKGVRLQDDDQLPFYTGYEYGTLYDWDQYFEGIMQLYVGWSSLYIINAVRMFLARQDKDGHIGRSVPDRWHHDMVKPFLAQLAVLALHKDGQIEWLRGDLYGRMRGYVENWLFKKDLRGDGLSVWMSAGHTGMDNQHERAGNGTDSFCEGIDLNAYLVREAEAFAVLAAALGEDEDARRFRQHAEARAQVIRQTLWDEDAGMFFDRDARDGRVIRVKHAGVFAALWAGVATDTQAQRLVLDHLLNPDEFWREWPLPALSADEPGYRAGFASGDHPRCCSWRAHTWIPTNYYAFQGLRRYGFGNEASALCRKTWELFLIHPFYEYYVTESGLGTGLRPFWGWSGLALFMPLEDSRGLDPTVLSETNPAQMHMHEAVANVLFGDGRLDDDAKS